MNASAAGGKGNYGCAPLSTLSMKRFKHIDLPSLICLDALVTEGSVSRAAEQLGMSQPGMSNALSRLRKLLRDPLMVQTPRGMIPTVKAIEVAKAVRQSIGLLDAVLTDAGPFDSATAAGKVRIVTSDYAGQRLFPAVMQRMSQRAPGLTLDLRLPDPDHVREWLEEGRCDLFVGHFPAASGDLHVSHLFEEPMVCIARTGHPTVGVSLTLDVYIACRHVIFGSPFAATSTLEATVEASLRMLHKERQVGMQVASVLLPAHMVAATDLIATIGRGLAQHQARSLPISVHRLPFEAPHLAMSLVWHERTHRSALQQWMRTLIREVAAELADSVPA